MKWHFNHVSSSQINSSLEKVQEELEFQPPVVLTLEDIDVANGMMNGHTSVHLEPGEWPAGPDANEDEVVLYTLNRHPFLK
jgi:hypothetical protein